MRAGIRLAAVVAALAVVTLSVAACNPVKAGVPAAAVGTTGIPVYTGLGDAPSEGGTGTWLRGNGNDWFWWAAGGASAGIMAAAVAKRDFPATRGRRIAAELITNPCWDPDHNIQRPPSSQYKIAQWAARLSGAISTNPRNANPFLTCHNFYNFLTKWGVPTRMKWMYECIQNILANGAGLSMKGPKANAYRYGWADRDGWVVASRGSIEDIKPIGGNWKTCAEATG